MLDALMLAIGATFFAVCIAYISLCDRIIGADLADTPRSQPSDAVVTEATSS